MWLRLLKNIPWFSGSYSLIAYYFGQYGTFSINESLAENTSLNGFNDVTGADIGTWYLEWSNYNRTDRAAPIVSGTIDISKDGDVYTLSLDGKDDAGNSITAHWSGTPDCYDRSGYSVPSVKNHPALLFLQRMEFTSGTLSPQKSDL